jgi:chromosome segregation ATPase
LKALDRLGRRRRDRYASTQPDAPFSVESCECLVDGSFALLRVAGAGSTAPTSLIAEGERPQSFQPLPQPGAQSHDALWHIAFAVPADLAEPSTRLWLHDGGVYLVELLLPAELSPPAAVQHNEVAEPAEEPVSAGERMAAEKLAMVEERIASEKAAAADKAVGDDEPGDDPRARKLVEAWSEAASLREKLSDREEDLADALKELLDARRDVQPLRDRAKALTSELADVRDELELAHKQGREARLRGTEKAAELDAVRAELAAAEPRVAEAERARELAEQEVASLRGQVTTLEQELVVARAEVEGAIREAEAKLESTKAEADAHISRLTAEIEAERTRLTSEAAGQQQTAEKLRSKVDKLEAAKESRRSGFGRRRDDRAVQKVRAELEGQIGERQQRIEQLEQEAESFAARRDEAVSASLQERIAALEEEVRQYTSCNDDLRALLDSERELVAAARSDARELKRQLAAASASRTTPEAPVPVPAPPAAATIAAATSGDAKAERAAAGPPPWSALDDELLARIEKAKALTG